MRDLFLIPAACFELLRLGVISGFRFRGPYWQWRMHTAFGRGNPEGGRLGLLKAALEYGKWMHQQRMSKP